MSPRPDGVPARVARPAWPPRRSTSPFTTLTTFGTPRDITLAELAVELFCPADERTAALLRGWQAGRKGSDAR